MDFIPLCHEISSNKRKVFDEIREVFRFSQSTERRIGNSLMIAIPSQVVDDLKLKAGDYMLLDIKDSTIVVRKQTK